MPRSPFWTVTSKNAIISAIMIPFMSFTTDTGSNCDLRRAISIVSRMFGTLNTNAPW